MAAMVWSWVRCNVTQVGKGQRRSHICALMHRVSLPNYRLARAWMIVLLLWMGLLAVAAPDVRANEMCEALASESGSLNTAEESLGEGEITVIGHLPAHNYVVVVPGRRDSLLMDVRQYVPDAFMASSRLGRYVHAGAFETRDAAETLSMQLRACKIRSRVVYFRNGRPV